MYCKKKLAMIGNSGNIFMRKEIKGSVQQKLRWVRNSANHNHWLLIWDHGAGHFFLSYSTPTSCIEHNSVSGQFSAIN
jgi:hypothetical protein